MTKFNVFTLLFIFVIIVFSCNKDEDELKYQAPIFYTEPVTEINEEGATFSAKVIQLSDNEIIDHGFVWSKLDEPKLGNAYCISMGSEINDNNFSNKINSSLSANETFNVRAFIKTNESTYYGSNSSFKSLGDSAPIIYSLSADTATWNDTISIIGKNFGYNTLEKEVKFGRFTSIIIGSYNDSIINCIVPFELDTFKSKISVSVQNNIDYSDDFTLTPPIITSINPQTGVYDQSIKIRGNYFKEEMTKVFFGEMKSEIDFTSDTLIVAKVPANLTGGEKNLKITVLNQDVVYKFTNLTPIIKNVYPDSVTFGEEIIVVGENFNPVLEHNQLYFCNIIQNINYYSDDTLKFNISSDIIFNSDKCDISIEVGGDKYLYEEAIIIKKPKFIDVDPTNFTFGDTITIHCSNLNPQLDGNEFKLNNSIIPYFKNGDKVEIIIPNDLVSENGQFNLSVNSNGLVSNYSEALILKAPEISLVSSLYLVIGDTISIYGNNFNPNISYNSVKIGELDATITESNQQELKAIIPFETEVNNNTIKITVNNQENLYTEKLNLLQPIIDSISPDNNGFRNEILTIYGRNFSSNNTYNRLYLNGKIVIIIENNRDKISFKINSIVSDGTNEIILQLGKQIFSFTDYFHHEPYILRNKFDFSISDYKLYSGNGIKVGDKIFAGIGGYIGSHPGSSNYSRTTIYPFLWEYDYNSDLWSRMSDFPEPSSIYKHPIVLAKDNNIYTLAHQILWKYSIDNNTWDSISQFPRDYYFAMIKTGYVYNNSIFIILGKQHWEFNLLTESWTQNPDVPDLFTSLSNINGNDVYFLGTGDNNRIWKYNFISKTWSVETNLPTSVNYKERYPSFIIDNELYYGCKGRLWKYSLSDNSWKRSRSIFPNNYLMNNSFSVVINNEIFIGGGVKTEYGWFKVSEYFYEYDVSKDIFIDVTK